MQNTIVISYKNAKALKAICEKIDSTDPDEHDMGITLLLKFLELNEFPIMRRGSIPYNVDTAKSGIHRDAMFTGQLTTLYTQSYDNLIKLFKHHIKTLSVDLVGFSATPEVKELTCSADYELPGVENAILQCAKNAGAFLHTSKFMGALYNLSL